MAQTDLNSRYDHYSKLADRIARLILVGLAVEIAAVFILQKPWSEAILTVSANALIVLGVWGELIFERRAKEASDAMVAQAKQEALDAIRAAEQARLELEKYRAPRVLNDVQMAQIADKVSRFSPIAFDANVNPGHPECDQCLRHIELALGMAGWQQIDWTGGGATYLRQSIGLPSFGATASVSNVVVGFRLDPEIPIADYRDPAIALADALTAEGIVASARPSAETGIGKSAAPIHLVVGPKT